jgi:antibiotic biosynthesis monooxygenase (ABM) superfamily enzyme
VFVNVIHFSPIKPGKEAEILAWCAWSSEQYAKHKGFISRKLLDPHEGDN